MSTIIYHIMKKLNISMIPSLFPIMYSEACSSQPAQQFLLKLGLIETNKEISVWKFNKVMIFVEAIKTYLGCIDYFLLKIHHNKPNYRVEPRLTISTNT